MRPLLVIALGLILVGSACGAPVESPAADLAGRTFIAATLMTNGIETDVALSPPTISFFDGQVNGHNGCNSYVGVAFIGNTGSFSLGALGQTKMFCVDTADIETAFNAAASRLTRWKLDGQKLTLSSDDGETSIVLVEMGPAAIN